MNLRRRLERDAKIITYLAQGNTLFDTAIHFKLSVNQIARIKKKNQEEFNTQKAQFDQLKPQ